MGDGAPFSPASAIFAAATEEILESYRDALHQSRNLADGRDYRSLHDICRVLDAIHGAGQQFIAANDLHMLSLHVFALFKRTPKRRLSGQQNVALQIAQGHVGDECIHTVAKLAGIIMEAQKEQMGGNELDSMLIDLQAMSDEEAERLLADETKQSGA